MRVNVDKTLTLFDKCAAQVTDFNTLALCFPQ
jgi:hypothetical protein